MLGSVDSGYLGSDGKVPLTLGSGSPFRGIESAWLTLENGLLIFHAYRNQGNRYAAVATTANARAGAEIIWQLPNSILKDSPDLTALTNALDAAVAAADAGAANQMLAAAAGAACAEGRTVHQGGWPNLAHEQAGYSHYGRTDVYFGYGTGGRDFWLADDAGRTVQPSGGLWLCTGFRCHWIH